MTMIRLTDAAAEHIKNLVEQSIKHIGFRLSVKKTGCAGLSYLPSIVDKAIEGDVHFVADNGLIVFVDPACTPLIEGLVIDYADVDGMGLKQKRLVFLNPQEKNRCGCGESFTVE